MATGTPHRCSWVTPAMLLLLLILEHGVLAKPRSPPEDTVPMFESCGNNMVCVYRRHCQDRVMGDFSKIKIPHIKTENKCSRVLHICCKEDKVSLEDDVRSSIISE